MNSSAPSKRFRPSKRGSWAAGQPISDLMSQALANSELISLAAGFVDEQSLPTDETQYALEQLFADRAAARKALQYGSTLGDPALRSAILDLSFAGESGKAHVEQVIITAGSNQLLHLVAEVLLDPGDIVLCAAPSYLVFLGTLANLGVETVGLETDGFGLVPQAVEAQLKLLHSSGQLERVKAIYLVPYFDNPRGITMPAERVSAIIEIAKRWSTTQSIFVIADEAYRELRYEGDEVASAASLDNQGDTVIVAGTFSKSFSPGLRVGWGILPKCLVAPVADLKGNIDFGSPNINQVVMQTILENGAFARHVTRIRASYADKLRAMLQAADEFLAPLPGIEWTCPSGGLYVWAELPAGIDTGPDGELLEQAISEGVLYVPGQYAFAAAGVPAKRNSMRLSFGVQSSDRIRAGVEALATAIVRVLR